ncbi:MAG: hypothetical protein JRI23_14460 [Deltaproteobacteria bacterium]|nr:hypothetical protein [Deltaproteobacteria bacterium]MBW2532948.1 hypothetical protein [Deltaproteobacteria bacterium]
MIGCKAPPSSLPPDAVLSYAVDHLSGSVSLVVKADGTAEYRKSVGFGVKSGTPTLRATVSPQELRALAAKLRANDFCSLRSGRDTGVPDEARPTIAVRLEDLDCRVQLWNGEFRDKPTAQASLKAVEALVGVVAKRATP